MNLIAPLGTAMGINLIGAAPQDAIFKPTVQAEAVAAFSQRFPAIELVYSLMDTSIEARALGCAYEFKGRVPAISNHPGAFGPLPDPWQSEPMRVNLEAVTLIRAQTDKPLVSYVVGPVTLAAHIYGITPLIMLSRRNKAEFENVLQQACAVIKPYARALCAAGADYIVILEPQALIFAPQAYSSQIAGTIAELTAQIPQAVLHVCGDTTPHAQALAATANIKALSLDWQVDFSSITPPAGVSLMGNIDPVALLQNGSPQEIHNAVTSLLESMQGRDFILATGCDMVPDTPPENLDSFIDAALEWRTRRG